MIAPRPSSLRRALLALAAPTLLALVAMPAHAQGKGHGGNGHGGNGRGSDNHGAASGSHANGGHAAPVKATPKVKTVPPGQAKRRVTHDQAVLTSRQVLVEQGYVVQRVERRGDTRVIYFYRGNRGRGKGHGPLQHMIVRPRADRFVFDGAPPNVTKAVTTRLRF